MQAADDMFDARAASPMLVGRHVNEPYDDPASLFELRLEGGRAFAYCSPQGADLINRRDVRLLTRFPELHGIHASVNGKCILDGVVLIMRHNKPDFAAYNARALATDPEVIALAAHKRPALFMAFDIVHHQGRNLAALPLVERRRILENAVTETELLKLSRPVAGSGNTLFALVREQGSAGMIAKKTDSRYAFGKASSEWTSVRHGSDEDFIIVGYSGQGEPVVSLVLGRYARDNRLTYTGRVSLPASSDDFRLIKQAPRLKRSPFHNITEEHPNSVWLKPEHVCVVSRGGPSAGPDHPVYKGLRLDKTPDEVLEPPIDQR